LCYSGNNDLSEREVLLKGEAYFSVDHDNRSFTVRTKNAAIKVLGTKFNVKSRRNKTSVYVKKGVVSVRNMLGDSTKKVILHKNESSACVDSQPPLKPVVVDSTLVPGWMENKFVFHKTSIREIIEELQYSFGKKIVLKDGDLGKLTVTGVFEQQDIESILSSICLTLNLEYSLSSGTYYIFSKK
jgi:ferric-dicitrate binding protein FerR (iron transport regulator)